MTYQRFENLPVWKLAMQFALRVFALAEDPCFNGKGDTRDQSQRSSTSIHQNIAEGFERGSTSELLMFLYIARGSAGEARSILWFCKASPWAAHLKGQIGELIAMAENISRQIRGWTDSLQDSDIDGQRHLNEISRAEWDRARRTTAFIEKLKTLQAKPPVTNGHSPDEI